MHFPREANMQKICILPRENAYFLHIYLGKMHIFCIFLGNKNAYIWKRCQGNMHFPGEANMQKICILPRENAYFLHIFGKQKNKKTYLQKSRCQGNMHFPREANIQTICILPRENAYFLHIGFHCSGNLEVPQVHMYDMHFLRHTHFWYAFSACWYALFAFEPVAERPLRRLPKMGMRIIMRPWTWIPSPYRATYQHGSN